MKNQWWKESVVYQIYPQSFYDSNGDGIGDLQGIIEKLDYVHELGVDVIWLNPVYDSPLDDNGYDIRDYYRILSGFGTMKDFDELLDQIHRRGMKLVMDLVVNHTSDEHQWFVESKKSRDNPYRNYYIWKKPVNGGMPNNWHSYFGGPAWEYDNDTGEYYLHLFSKKQVDLNWENVEVRTSVYEMMRWWLDKGIDGFRMDVINAISKEFHPEAPQHDRFLNGPKIHTYLKEMNRSVLSQYDITAIGETPGATIEDAKQYAGFDTNEVDMVFQFEHVEVDLHGEGKFGVHDFRPEILKEVMFRWQRELDGIAWNSIYLSNHDQPRALSRFGNDKQYRKESAKLLAMYTLSLQGTPYIYQGEEIGMTNACFDSIDQYRDIEALNYYNEAKKRGIAEADIIQKLQYIGRDNSRTPMQWNNSKHAGFTTGTPWIEVNPNYTQINTDIDRADPGSVFMFYKEMIALRKQTPALIYGSFHSYLDNDPALFVYERRYGEERYMVLLNFTGETVTVEKAQLPECRSERCIIANYPEPPMDMLFRPYEGVVYRCAV